MKITAFLADIGYLVIPLSKLEQKCKTRCSFKVLFFIKITFNFVYFRTAEKDLIALQWNTGINFLGKNFKDYLIPIVLQLDIFH